MIFTNVLEWKFRHPFHVIFTWTFIRQRTWRTIRFVPERRRFRWAMIECTWQLIERLNIDDLSWLFSLNKRSIPGIVFVHRANRKTYSQESTTFEHECRRIVKSFTFVLFLCVCVAHGSQSTSSPLPLTHLDTFLDRFLFNQLVRSRSLSSKPMNENKLREREEHM